MDGQPELNLHVLGELTATRDGAVVDLGGRRQRAVLAALAMQRDQVVTADHLVDCVWGDHPPANAHGALQAYVSHLRRRLEPDATARQREGVIARAGPGYVLRLRHRTPWTHGPSRPRSSRRRARRRGTRCARSRPHCGCGAARRTSTTRGRRGPRRRSPGSPSCAAVARERLLGTRLELGEAQLVIGDLEALVKEDPLREERWRLLTLALYRSHRQAAALEALRRARTVLADELGVDPGPALRALEAEVLAQSPDLDGPTPKATKDATALIPRPRTPDGLVDRDDELALLRARLDDLADGTSGCLLVEGPAGIGKTRLLDELRRLAVSSRRVRSVRAEQRAGAGLRVGSGPAAVRVRCGRRRGER